MSTELLHLAFVATLVVPLGSALGLGLLGLLKRPLREREVAAIAQSMTLAYLGAVIVLVLSWALMGGGSVHWELLKLPFHKVFEIECEVVVDHVSAVFLLVTAIVANIVVFFSRRYLHRDPGFRRFFFVLALFLAGLSLLFCAASFDFVFAGWEIIGLSSFLLIAFYWHRPSAVLNAKRAYFVYRFCDVGLLAGVLLHHHEAVTPGQRWLMSGLLLLPALGKSAQLPFSFWLPRALEGPTPSSAIFYGSLSLHAGVFLLLRTHNIWYSAPGFCWLLGGIGFLSAVSATLCARVQTNIKGQIAYASIAQVGLMFVALSLGFWNWVLVHFAGHAFLRCFQMLVSASIVSEQLQIHGALEGQHLKNPLSIERFIPARLRNSHYVFAINEGFIEAMIKRFIAGPLQKSASALNRWLSIPRLATSFALVLPLGIVRSLPLVVLGLSIVASLVAFGEQKRPLKVVHLVAMSHLLALLAMLLDQKSAGPIAMLFLFGLLASWFVVFEGYRHALRGAGDAISKRFLGLYATHPLTCAVSLLGVLGLIGFPVATTFFAEDLILALEAERSALFVVCLLLSFVLNGITMMRLHSRLFYGSREREYDGRSKDLSSGRAFLLLSLFVMLNACGFVLVGMW